MITIKKYKSMKSNKDLVDYNKDLHMKLKI